MQIEKLGPYRIGKQLGRGGMGTVFAATTEEGEPAAVKVLAVGLSRDEAFRGRFEAEIETLRLLRHPHIVRLLGFGEDNGVLYYAMELVEGASLEETIRSGKQLSWERTCRLCVQMCSALKHAHDRGVIHRDIKPANLLLTNDGNLKLADFGIAKLFGASSMTSAGGAIGTAEYMAPEQADGRPVSHRADLYSLGAVMYAMLAGRPPFIARSVLEMLQMQRFSQPESVRRHVVDLPEEIDAIVLQLLEKDPERRPPNATILARRLEATALGLAMRAQKTAVPSPSDPQRTNVGRTAVEGDFQLGEPGPSSGSRPVLETRASTRLAPKGSGVDLIGVTQVTGDLAPASTPAVETAPLPQNRFVKVAPDEKYEPLEDEEPRPWVSPQTWGLIAAIVATGLAIWYFLQPPSAENLYDRIQGTIREQGTDGLTAVEDDIQSFMRYYPNDPRVRELERHADTLAMLRLERRFEQRLRRQTRYDGLSPLELAYQEAMKVAVTDPVEGAARLHALLRLYENDDTLSSDALLCLRLARRQLMQLEVQAARLTAEHRQLLESRLATADRLAENDPAAAQSLWRSIVLLYDRRPWAETEVALARQRLAASESGNLPDVAERAAPLNDPLDDRLPDDPDDRPDAPRGDRPDSPSAAGSNASPASDVPAAARDGQ